MVSCVLYVAICGSFLGFVEGVATAVGGQPATRSISAHVNMMAIGDPTISTAADAVGHVGVTYYDYRSSDWTGREAVLLNPYVFNTGTGKVTYGDYNTDVDGNHGFGYALACANDETIFISACNQSHNSGRVYLYKGRNAHWTAQQILNSYRIGPSEIYSSSADTFFGEAMDSSEGVLAVGCRNCNSTIKGYANSGEIYIFRPEKEKKSVLWTNTQVLTGKDIYFMGGHVAMHENVIVASGNSQAEEFTYNTIETTPILASIFLADDYLATTGPKSEFKYQQNIVTRDPIYQRIADVAVYDMTVAMATYDTVRDTNYVYIFYPNTKKYNLDSKDAKGKPRPLSWSLTQVLGYPVSGETYNFQFPTYLSMWDNKLFMRAKTSGKDVTLDTNRTTRSGAYHVFYHKNDVNTQPNTHMMTTSDFKLFQDGIAGTAVLSEVTDLTSADFNCIRIWVEDEFDDGWDTAELIVESPNGIKRSYKTECDSINPLVHRYCPVFNDELESMGIHKLYVINGKEAKFNWEILWRVYDEATATWTMGDINTEMDFEWQYRERKFVATREHHIRYNQTCTVCPQSASEWTTYQNSLHPSKPKAKALQNLRALHSRTDTSSPTMTPAPTIDVDFNKDWNVVEMINDVSGSITSPWFDGQGEGTFFHISDTEGKHLVYSGSACTAGDVSVGCYVKLDDGEYVIRVTGANDPHTADRHWKFCQAANYIQSQTELYFSIVDGVCFPVMTRHQTLVCDNVLKITHLSVEIALMGDFSAIVGNVNMNQVQPAAMAVSSALKSILNFEEFSASISKIKISASTMIVVLVDIGVKNFDPSKYSTLETLELGAGRSYKSAISSHVLSAPVSLAYDGSVMKAVTSVSVMNVKLGSETIDYASEDESNFHTVTDFIPQSSTIQPPSNMLLIESEHVIAVGGYLIAIATLFVAVGFIYSNIKRHVLPMTEEKAPIRPSAARISLQLGESSSDDDSDDVLTSDEEKVTSRRLKSMVSKPLTGGSSKKVAPRNSKSSADLKLKNLLASEDAVYRKGSRHRPTGSM